jgi:hypothetical protein
VSSTFVQPFISYTTKTYTSFGANTESTYDWENEQWTVPFNLTVQQVLKIGQQPVSFQLGGRYYAEAPTGGPDWGLRFVVTFLFPTRTLGARHFYELMALSQLPALGPHHTIGTSSFNTKGRRYENNDLTRRSGNHCMEHSRRRGG